MPHPALITPPATQRKTDLPGNIFSPITPPTGVARRMAALMAQLPEASRWQRIFLRFTSQFKQNMAELEALMHYSSSPAVWDIARLTRKKAQQKLSPTEQQELDCLTTFHDSPSVHRITSLKLKEYTRSISVVEQRELTHLQRNLYQGKGIPTQVLDLLWTQPPQNLSDHFI
ncbi:hypothetical protein [Vampirovibrio chlorellavorus]|uniref:hypothetical protein n=1 Tax=Vampirovibrio chlorellavorus TaxID=758823 RepID=UPI0026EBF353|nr:hypothetical protein [Vampirovibrio chlorellavorus]